MNPMSTDERELSSLMGRTLRGDRDAYRSLLNRVEKLVRSYAVRSLRRAGIPEAGRSEDIVQEILLAIHSKRQTFDTTQLFLPWMYAIARYKIVDAMRVNKKRRTDVEVTDATLSTETSTDAIDVDQLLEALPSKQRVLLGLVKLDGLTAGEAAKQTGYSESDVKVSVHRAMKSLKKKLGGS